MHVIVFSSQIPGISIFPGLRRPPPNRPTATTTSLLVLSVVGRVLEIKASPWRSERQQTMGAPPFLLLWLSVLADRKHACEFLCVCVCLVFSLSVVRLGRERRRLFINLGTQRLSFSLFFLGPLQLCETREGFFVSSDGRLFFLSLSLSLF